MNIIKTGKNIENIILTTNNEKFYVSSLFGVGYPVSSTTAKTPQNSVSVHLEFLRQLASPRTSNAVCLGSFALGTSLKFYSIFLIVVVSGRMNLKS